MSIAPTIEAARPLNRLAHYDIFVSAALMAWVSFSMPGRDGPNSAAGLDLLGAAKLLIRLSVIAWFGIDWLRFIVARVEKRTGQRSMAGTIELLRSPGLWCSPVHLPWFAFLIWAFLSILWSPLKSVSIGQWLGFLALLLFSQGISLRAQTSLAQTSLADETRSLATRATKGPASFETLSFQLYLILATYCVVLLAVHVVSPSSSGLDRSVSLEGSNGLVHPTAAGATSSLAVVLGVFLCVKQASKFRFIIAATTALSFVVLVLSNSRAAMAVTLVCLVVMGSMLFSRKLQGLCLLAGGLIALAAITLDPGFRLAGESLEKTLTYVQRGQTAHDLRGVSGRSELWSAVWEQFQSSPLLGHGYFVTSSNGRLDVWDGPDNHDAHNIFLQVLVSTGLIGGILFSIALAVAFYALFRLAIDSWDPTEGLSYFVGLLIVALLWFAGWGQGCVTFLGPIRPESVVFALLLGLLGSEYWLADKSLNSSWMRNA